ncbi:MAG: mechanosensitive ion channel family protein [Chlorobi bacterium]|nr:mechanosensitive ion channel family protein [Chlorobiota bacterium]
MERIQGWIEDLKALMPDWFFIKIYEDFTLFQLFLAIAFFFIFLGLLYLIRSIVVRRLRVIARKSSTYIDDFILDFIYNKLGRLFYIAIALFLTAALVKLPSGVEKAINLLFVIVMVFYAARFFGHLVDVGLRSWLKGDDEEARARASLARTLSLLAKMVVWAIAIILMLDNLGFNVTGLIAGLGIGGLAIGLAVQNILQDIVASFSIQIDRPFVEGDLVEIGDKVGTVEQIGIKTTRMRSLFGEEISIPNRTIVDSFIHNYGRMKQRKLLLSFGVIYETALEKLERIPDMVRQIFAEIPKTTVDRVHFKNLGDFSLDYEVLVTIDDPTYNYLMDVRQQFNLKITKLFREEGIEFAYPTQVIYLNPVNADQGNNNGEQSSQ